MASLAETEIIWRRVTLQHRHADGRAKSSAFRTESYCVHVASKTTTADVAARYPDDHFYEFTVAQAVAGGATDVDDTLEAGDPKDHAMIRPGSATKKERFAKHVMRVARRVWPPPPVLASTGVIVPPVEERRDLAVAADPLVNGIRNIVP